MEGNLFNWASEVKDSELDIQGIVNNSVYSIYMEHCRHKLLKHIGLDFAQLHKAGIDLVARECTIKFLHPLTSGDKFVVTAKAELINKIKFYVHQEIFRKSDSKKILQAVYTIIGINRETNKLYLPDELINCLQ